MLVQVELHPYLQQQRLVAYARSQGLVLTAFSPLGNGKSYWQEVTDACSFSFWTVVARYWLLLLGRIT
jgi:diketogulonate reductase-like aldo/keto reductase